LLLLLAVVFADNFVGRQILAVMIEPINRNSASAIRPWD
jgi:hypothetical protein